MAKRLIFIPVEVDDTQLADLLAGAVPPHLQGISSRPCIEPTQRRTYEDWWKQQKAQREAAKPEDKTEKPNK